jgi:hypothetical protein
MKKKLAALVIAAAATLSLTSCGSFSAGTAHCTSAANDPHESNGTRGDIVGKSRTECDTRVDKVVNVVRLEQYVNGKWIVVSAEFKETWSKPVPGERYTNQAQNVSCRKGLFRTATRGYGVYLGKTYPWGPWDYRERRDPCG